jgi:hypothetical protein
MGHHILLSFTWNLQQQFKNSVQDQKFLNLCLMTNAYQSSKNILTKFLFKIVVGSQIIQT